MAAFGNTNLLGAIFLSGKLDLAHTTGTNRLAEDPFARLCRNGGASRPLFRSGCASFGCGLHDGGHRSRPPVVDYSSRAGHVGVVVAMSRGVGSRAAAAVDAFGVGASRSWGAAIFTRWSLGVLGYVTLLIIVLGKDVLDGACRRIGGMAAVVGMMVIPFSFPFPLMRRGVGAGVGVRRGAMWRWARIGSSGGGGSSSSRGGGGWARTSRVGSRRLAGAVVRVGV